MDAERSSRSEPATSCIASKRLEESGMNALYLLVTDRLDGIQLRGLHSRINAEQKTDADRNPKRHADTGGRHHGGPPRGLGDDLRQGKPKKNTDQSSHDRNEDGLCQELTNDVGLACADRATNSDLARAFQHRREHDVHDSDAADQQRNALDTDHDHLE